MESRTTSRYAEWGRLHRGHTFRQMGNRAKQFGQYVVKVRWTNSGRCDEFNLTDNIFVRKIFMPDPAVPADVLALAQRLADAKPMRRGSLSERYVKCSKPDCACSEDADARHGPYYSVSRVVEGKTQSRWLNAEAARIVRRRVELGQQFRKQIETYWEACERWADGSMETWKQPQTRPQKKGL